MCRAERTAPVWLVSNGFHTSLGFRVADAPAAREYLGLKAGVSHGRQGGMETFLVGWGATDFYRGRVDVISFGKALAGSGSLLHVVPVRGEIRARFPHSDVVRLNLSRTEVRRLLADVDTAFARDGASRLVPEGKGYYDDSRFYLGQERFYFPQMCNLWVAEKLRRRGVRIFLPVAIMAPCLMWEAGQIGVREQRRSAPADAY